MSKEFEEMTLTPLLKASLPLGYARIVISAAIVDAEATQRATLELPKYRHSVMYARHAGKPISKPEL